MKAIIVYFLCIVGFLIVAFSPIILYTITELDWFLAVLVLTFPIAFFTGYYLLESGKIDALANSRFKKVRTRNKRFKITKKLFRIGRLSLNWNNKIQHD